MLILYSLFACMLIVAIFLIALPFIKDHKLFSKQFLIITLFMALFTMVLYQYFCQPHAVQQWFAQGEKHYQLQVEIAQLGGIDGIIAKIKERLKTNPNDAQGWLILGKLYLGQHDYAHAKEAFARAATKNDGIK